MCVGVLWIVIDCCTNNYIEIQDGVYKVCIYGIGVKTFCWIKWLCSIVRFLVLDEMVGERIDF